MSILVHLKCDMCGIKSHVEDPRDAEIPNWIEIKYYRRKFDICGFKCLNDWIKEEELNQDREA